MAASVLLASCQGPERTAATARSPSAAGTANVASERLLPLSLGAVGEARLTGGEAHLYILDLTRGQYAGLIVEQQGIDVVATLHDPGGHRLAWVDGPSNAQGPEYVPVVAEIAGRYRLEVRSLDASVAPGRYRILLEALRDATPRDRTHVAAERLLAEADELRDQRGDGPSLRRALVQSRQAATLFRSLDERGREGDALFSLGYTQYLLWDAAAATEILEQALAIFRQQDLRPQTISALNMLGQLHRARGRQAQALAGYREALALSRQIRDRRREVVTLNNLGKFYDGLGEVERALPFYEQALAGWRELRSRRDEAITLYNLAHLYQGLGEPREALDVLTQALALLPSHEQGRPRATILGEIGVVRALCGQEREGLEPLRLALRLQQQIGNRTGEALALNNLAWLLRRLGELHEARRLYARSRDLYHALEDRWNEAIVRTNLALVDQELGRPQEAIAAYRQALPLLAASGYRPGEAGALLRLARALRSTGDLAAAREAAETALDIIESLRSEPASLQLRASFLASNQEHYAFYIDLLMELDRREPSAGHAARALAASERARARSLLDLLGEAHADLRHGIDRRLLEQEAELGRLVNAADRRRHRLLDAGASRDQLAAADGELRQLLRRYDRVQTAIRLASPRYAALTQPRPLSLRDIQEQVLDGETLLFEYALGEDRSFLWAVTPEALASFELAPRRVIEEAAHRAYELLAASHHTLARGAAETALAELSRLLLAPAAPWLSRKRILIVGDGALHYIPFGVLPLPSANGTGPAPVPLLAEHEVVALPSASSLAALRRETAGRPPAPGALAVVADPVFEVSDPRVRKPPQQRPAAVAARLRRLPQGERPARFQRLPFSREEAESILNLAPPARSLKALDFAASRETVLGGALASYGIVHFATHGIFDAEHPELSGILLSMVDPEGRPRDGFLRAHEIYRLNLAADLVVLSACQTALGDEIHGEGLVGITRGFMYAGARLLLVSLWEVEDRATAELMRRFYREMLAHGKPPAAALRTAQASLRREPGWAAPYYWGGFVLQGDWRAGAGR